MKRIVAIFSAALSLASCTGPGARYDTAASIAQQGDLRPASVKTQRFTLAAFARNPQADKPVVVYVEGDGLAWVSRSQPSSDPTPRDPIGLRLAAVDPSPNVIYLARPCQYVWSASCAVPYWTDRRFAEEVVAAMSAALDQLVSPGQKIHLVGYSGGGGIAAILAARRHDVASLRTVAGNLDHETLSRIHNVSPMAGSLNPRDSATALAGLPQLHFVGGRDEVVPSSIAGSFLRAMGPSACAQVIPVADAAHGDGWAAFWRTGVGMSPGCAP